MGISEDLTKASCYTINIGELMQELSTSTIIEDDKVVITPVHITELLNLLVAKITETLKECEGKDFIVRLPNTFLYKTIVELVKVLGIEFKYEFV